MTAEQRRRELDALYAEIPPMVNCRGRCAVSCGPIDMSDEERDRIAERGVAIAPLDPKAVAVWARGDVTKDRAGACPALGLLGQCTVYAIRPLICRLWGATESLLCPFGCRPERLLTDDEAFDMIARAMRIGGWDRGDIGPTMRAALADPLARSLVQRLVRGESSVADALETRVRALHMSPP